MPLDPERVRTYDFPAPRFEVTEKDAMLYALGLGIGSDPLDPRQLRHVYEKALAVFPTMPVVLGSPGPWFADAGLDFRKLVHGAQALHLERPVPLGTPLTSTSRVVGLYDKGAEKGAVCDVERVIADQDGTVVARMVATYALRGDGGFGGEAPPRDAWTLPERAPDAEIVLPTLPQAALIYRLSGDMNPLHADPERARAVGFERPILHGLCTFGMMGRAVIEAFCPDDPGALNALSGRFTRPVYPGDTLSVSLWKDDAGHLFEARTGADNVVFTGGRASLG
ncbi:Acyl dehydratase [Salipiger thiooxidans]|uniref:Acyl dehydratase n=1 Tax=Salipiger thiooxidans TaxID=282683 RepID=A0A1G7FDZ0_9RHOB|nr:MaoC/PaaZ C-terminal domain-containing protein [Salipiger thiooxidans]SDE74128.1 Acyl dehydratase [Salipiger thiooxidans]